MSRSRRNRRGISRGNFVTNITYINIGNCSGVSGICPQDPKVPKAKPSVWAALFPYIPALIKAIRDLAELIRSLIE